MQTVAVQICKWAKVTKRYVMSLHQRNHKFLRKCFKRSGTPKGCKIKVAATGFRLITKDTVRNLDCERY